jgi:hypothetical protein
MRYRVLGLALAVAACSSSHSAAPDLGVAQHTFAIAGDAGAMTVVKTADAQTASLAGSVDDAWTALPQVLDSLGVRATLIDPAQHLAGVEQIKIRVNLGKTPLSRYLDCGQTQIGPNADSYEVLLTVKSRITSAAVGSQLSTIVDAVARPIAFRQNYSSCSSTGLLESRIADGVKKRLQR